MTDRDRLIELIADKQQDFQKWCLECAEDKNKVHQPFEEYLADKLLSNGFIVPVRCKDCEYYTPIIQASAKWKSKTFYCTRNANMKMNKTDFCSFGELKGCEQ